MATTVVDDDKVNAHRHEPIRLGDETVNETTSAACAFGRGDRLPSGSIGRMNALSLDPTKYRPVMKLSGMHVATRY